jgi:septum formation protein
MKITANLPIILASSSKIRSQILADSNIPFVAISPNFDEEKCKNHLINSFGDSFKISKIALELAIGKALSISSVKQNSLIIGSDQICEFEGKIINKSRSKEQAIEQISLMQGKKHLQNNAVVIALNNKIIFKKITIAKMTMRKLTKAEILQYVEADKPWGCAGSYQYESLGKHLFSSVSGDYHSILGLAIQPVLCFLYQKQFLTIQ